MKAKYAVVFGTAARSRTLSLAVLCLGSWGLLPSGAVPAAADEVGQCAAEIGSAIFTFGSLAPCDEDLYYLFRGFSTVELRARNLASGHTRVIETGQTAQRLFDWSPRQRYLLLKTQGDHYEAFPGRADAKPEYLEAYDRQTGRMIRITEQKMEVGNFPVWCGEGTFAFAASVLTRPPSRAKAFLVRLEDGGGMRQDPLVAPIWADVLSGKTKAHATCGGTRLIFARADTLSAGDLAGGESAQVAAVAPDQFAGFNWLNWSPETRRLLFCATPAHEIYRNLFALSPDGATPPERLSTVHTYNGQWLERGHGYAYVGNTNNHFYLAVRPRSPGDATNLFIGGYVERYAASPSGEYLVTVAMTNGEPRGLWHYDLATKRLHLLEPGNKLPFRRCGISVPRELAARSPDGAEIPVYLFSPPRPEAGKRRPLVVYIPPPSSQVRRGFEIQPQLLANLGFQYVGVNYRGCDGYGRAYSERIDVDRAAEDVHQGIKRVAAEVGGGAEKIALIACSAGCPVASRFAERYPSAVCGLVYQSPNGSPGYQAQAGHPWPRMLITVGQSDSAFAPVKDFEVWAKERSLPVQFQYLPNYGHFEDDIPGRVTQEKTIAEFLLSL